MIHVENPKLIEVGQNPDITNWTVHLVLRWSGGEPLNDYQQDAIAHSVVETGDSSIQALTLEAEPDIPYASMELDFGTADHELEAIADTYCADSSQSWARKELVLGKSIDSCLGGLACAGIDVEDITLETAFAADEEELHNAHPEMENPKLCITFKDHNVDEVAFGVFDKQKESYLELASWLKAA